MLCLLVAAPAAAVPLQAAGSPQPVQPATTGRVVATVTTLEGTVHLSGVRVDLRESPGDTVLATTSTDGVGQVVFPNVPPGRYSIAATRSGFLDRESAAFDVQANEAAQVLLDIQLTFVAPTVDVRAAQPSPTDSVQPVSMSDMLDGSIMESSPIEGDDFQSLLPLLPGIVRGPDGRLRIKGGQPTQGALQVSSASLIDPSTGDFDLELPAPSVESVEVLANPFAAEYGRFSSSVTQIRTRRGTNEWDFDAGNFVPRFRGTFSGVRGFEPRFSARGPIRRDRVFLAQDAQFRYVATPIRSLPDEPEVALMSVDSFTRLDSVISSGHTLGGGLILFPREIEHVTMDTFRPAEVSPDFRQRGWSAGLLDRFSVSPNAVLETTLASRQFEVEVSPDGVAPMVFAPQRQSGSFFNDQERNVRSVQWVEAVSVSRVWHGEHVIKVGADLQWSRYSGYSQSRPVEVRRLDGSLAERTVFAGQTLQHVRGTEFAVFGQDRWRLGSRVTLEMGLRSDRDPVVEAVTWSPRAGIAVTVLPEGRGILRGGLGRFAQRAPLNVEAFPSFERRVVSRFDAAGAPLGPAIAFDHVVAPGLRTPSATVGSMEWDERFGRRVLLKIGYLDRRGEQEFILTPDAVRGELRLSSTGTSRYKELETTLRYLGGERRDITVSYVWAHGAADLNDFDQFYGNFRNPIVRANEYNLTPTDVRHRVIARGSIGLPGQWELAPIVELRSGFSWSAVNEYRDFVGPRSRAGRLPAIRTLDFQLTRPWQWRRYRFRAGLRMYNAFASSAGRDVQNNVTAPDYGTSYNPIEQSIGIVLGASR